MAKFAALFSFKPEVTARMIEKPSDRAAAARDLAKSIGLDMDKYGACMDADTHRAKIQAHLAEAERRQVQSTPTFVFNGTMVPRALPYDRFKYYVDSVAKLAPANGTSSPTDSTTATGKKS